MPERRINNPYAADPLDDAEARWILARTSGLSVQPARPDSLDRPPIISMKHERVASLAGARATRAAREAAAEVESPDLAQTA